MLKEDLYLECVIPALVSAKKNAVKPLLEILEETESKGRVNAVVTLGKIKDESAVTRLLTPLTIKMFVSGKCG